MKKLLILFLICLSLNELALAQSKDEKAVAAAIETLRRAMIAGDKTQLENIVADALSYGHSSGKIENKTAFVDAIVNGTDYETII